jgi:uncharacterized protein YbjT (DUF2867 family)
VELGVVPEGAKLNEGMTLGVLSAQIAQRMGPGYAVEAERAGMGHVSFLSAYDMEHASLEVALRAVELDLGQRTELTHSLIRPAWFMHDFTETFLRPADGEIVVPNGDGAEAFASAEDIAAVAAGRGDASDPSLQGRGGSLGG